MYTQKEKAKKNQSRTVNEGSQKQNSSESAFQFVDNRPEAITQRKLIKAVNNSPRAMQVKGKVNQLKSEVINRDQNYNYLSGSIKVGSEMEAWLDPSDMPVGQSANLNTSQNDMMDRIRQYWGITGGDVVKGHLLNDNMGGTAMNYNLYPITRGANKDHLSFVENAVKQRIWSDQLGLYYKVSVDANPEISKPEADFDCEIKEWNPKSKKIGGYVMPPVTIPSDLRKVRDTGQAFVTHDGNFLNPIKRPKKPSWSTKPKNRVSDLNQQEYDDRMEQD